MFLVYVPGNKTTLFQCRMYIRYTLYNTSYLLTYLLKLWAADFLSRLHMTLGLGVQHSRQNYYLIYVNFTTTRFMSQAYKEACILSFATHEHLPV